MRNPPKQMDGIAGVLHRALSRIGLDRELDDYRVIQLWDEVVGPTVARNAQPTRLDSKRLVVVVRSAPWLQELGMLRRDLCTRLNAAMGRNVINEIFLVVGKIEYNDAHRSHAPRRKPEPAGIGSQSAGVTAVGAGIPPVARDLAIASPDMKAHGLSGEIAAAFDKLWRAKHRGEG